MLPWIGVTEIGAGIHTMLSYLGGSTFLVLGLFQSAYGAYIYDHGKKSEGITNIKSGLKGASLGLGILVFGLYLALFGLLWFAVDLIKWFLRSFVILFNEQRKKNSEE